MKKGLIGRENDMAKAREAMRSMTERAKAEQHWRTKKTGNALRPKCIRCQRYTNWNRRVCRSCEKYFNKND